MNKISEEKQESLKFMLSDIEYAGKKLVELTPRNVALIEAMIANDSNYLKGMDKNNKPKGKYRGSNSFWFNELKSILVNKKTSSYSYKDIIFNAVCAVDSENSTHLNADGVGRDEITKRILNIEPSKLIAYLKEPEKTDFEIIDIISEITHPKDKKKKARINTSFASKFCHYACFYLFEGTKYQDNFSIYDNILKESIPNYAKMYGIKCVKKHLDKNYKLYKQIIDNIIEKSGNKISRNGFDHLLWYYFKGRL